MRHDPLQIPIVIAGITLAIILPAILDLHYGRPLSWWLIWIFVGWCATIIWISAVNYRATRFWRIVMRESMADKDEKKM